MICCSCGDLSASSPGPIDDILADRGQLKVIFDVLGTPNTEDLAFLENREYAQAIANLPPIVPRNLSEVFQGADPLAFDLFHKLLAFDPAKRISIDEALQHPYLRTRRHSSWEVAAENALDIRIEAQCEQSSDILLENVSSPLYLLIACIICFLL